MSEQEPETICFIHYGIGWRDGINTVVKSLAMQIQKQRPDLGLCFLGGHIREEIVENASYQEIPELLPQDNGFTKEEIQKQAKIIAQKIAQATKGAKAVIIENPLMGDYHLPAMFGFLIYANEHKPKGTKVIFRIHDIYTDAPHYSKKLKEFFTEKEIRDMIQGQGVDNFLIINHRLKQELINLGAVPEKISYLPNGVDPEIFTTNLTPEEAKMARERIGLADGEKLLLYPVRVVPRKNVEEAILLTYFIRQMTNKNYALMITGKVDKSDSLSEGYYQVLKKIKELAGFKVIFCRNSHLDPFPLKRRHNPDGTIKRFSIADIFQISDAVIMTSLREGFGYPYLECWFTGKVVLGRRIEQVVGDFEKSGLNFDWLYKKFLLDPENSDSLEDEESFAGAKKVVEILKSKESVKQVFDLNKEVIEKQIEILQDKKKQDGIIKSNLAAAQKAYEISGITKQFLELVGL